jgi:membrane peptidoglycan carboxypeptidase
LRHLSRKHLRKARATEYRTRRNLWLTIGSTILSMLIILLSLGTAGSIVAYRFYTQTQTRYEHQVVTLRDLLPLDNLKMYDSKGVLLMQMTDQGLHTTVKLDDIAPVLQNATIATEDRYFWTNQGVDLTAIIRAAIADLSRGGVVEGGSTITQQLIKNLIVGNQSTIIRKLEEVVLTPQINSLYTKRDILEMYLNSIYYGHLAYGVDAAATIYFGLEDKPGKPASMQLDLAQAAMLAGIPSNPSAYDPLLHPETSFARFQNVLSLMVTQRYITKVEALDAIQEAQSPNFFKTAPSLINRAPHFTNFVLGQLVQLFRLRDTSQLSRSGMIVSTTLDINLQDKIQKIAQQRIAALRAAHNLTNAAEVIIDFRTGAIISLLGSIDYNNASIDGQFDVATQGYRQPGSSFKPYVYVTAFEQGASPAQAIDDAPTTINLPGGNPPTFSPNNYDMSFHGHMTLRCALQNSLNVPAVRVLQRVGINAAMKTAYDMGITTYQGTPGYSLVLGGLGVRLIDHTSAIGTFANGGVRVPYYAINKVVSGVTNKVLYQHQLDPGKRVISPQLAYMMTNVLSDNTSRIPEFFDCNVLQLYSNSQSDCWNGNRGAVRPAAAKTGTTQNFRDNWTVGYTTDYVMGVWAGNDNNTPMIDVTGVQGAAPIWHDSMLVAEQGRPIRNFVNPGGLQRATVTYPDGVTTTDWFLPGTVPTFNIAAPTPTDSTTDSTPTTGTPTPTPGGNPTPATVRPYCPNSYSFAFNPPASTTPPNGWW